MRWTAGIIVLTILACHALAQGEVNAPEKSISADDVFNGAIQIWTTGDDGGAEKVVEQARQTFPHDARFIFFQGARIRGYFDLQSAAPYFQYVAKAMPNDPYGRASKLILSLDSGRDIDANFKSLDDLSASNPKDVLLLWMDGVQCRTHDKNEIGVQRYSQLLKLIAPGPGPGIVHQTYANLLDNLNRFDDALPQRQLAVKLSPATWSYDGLGNTLTSLKRWKEADAAYQQATSREPNDARYWRHWAFAKAKAENYIAARRLLELAEQAEMASVTHSAPPTALSDEEALGIAEQSWTADQLYAAAVKAWREGDGDAANLLLSHGLDFFPKDIRFTFFAATTLWSQLRKNAAQKLFERTQSLQPDSALGRAAALIVHHSGPHASSYIQDAPEMATIVSERPDDPVLLFADAEWGGLTTDPAVADQLFEKLVPQLSPGTAEMHDMYAAHLLNTRQLEKTLSERRIALKLQPTALRYDLLGTALSDLRQWHEADGAFRKAVSLDPVQPGIWGSWATSKQQRGDQDGYSELMTKAQTAGLQWYNSHPRGVEDETAFNPD